MDTNPIEPNELREDLFVLTKWSVRARFKNDCSDAFLIGVHSYPFVVSLNCYGLDGIVTAQTAAGWCEADAELPGRKTSSAAASLHPVRFCSLVAAMMTESTNPSERLYDRSTDSSSCKKRQWIGAIQSGGEPHALHMWRFFGSAGGLPPLWIGRHLLAEETTG